MPSKKKKYSARFPPARIKKIMQTDEDVGKVAAAVPVVISRALELFIESLILKSAEHTKARNAKTLSSSHIKQIILSEKKFDFLKDLVANIPDVQTNEDEDAPMEHLPPKPRAKPTPPVPGQPPRPRGRPKKKRDREGPVATPLERRENEETQDSENNGDDTNSDFGDSDNETEKTASTASAAAGSFTDLGQSMPGPSNISSERTIPNILPTSMPGFAESMAPGPSSVTSVQEAEGYKPMNKEEQLSGTQGQNQASNSSVNMQPSLSGSTIPGGSFPPTVPGDSASPGANAFYPSALPGANASYPSTLPGANASCPSTLPGANASSPPNFPGANASYSSTLNEGSGPYPSSLPGSTASYPSNVSGGTTSYPPPLPGSGTASHPLPSGSASYPSTLPGSGSSFPSTLPKSNNSSLMPHVTNAQSNTLQALSQQPVGTKGAIQANTYIEQPMSQSTWTLPQQGQGQQNPPGISGISNATPVKSEVTKRATDQFQGTNVKTDATERLENSGNHKNLVTPQLSIHTSTFGSPQNVQDSEHVGVPLPPTQKKLSKSATDNTVGYDGGEVKGMVPSGDNKPAIPSSRVKLENGDNMFSGKAKGDNLKTLSLAIDPQQENLVTEKWSPTKAGVLDLSLSKKMKPKEESNKSQSVSVKLDSNKETSQQSPANTESISSRQPSGYTDKPPDTSSMNVPGYPPPHMMPGLPGYPMIPGYPPYGMMPPYNGPRQFGMAPGMMPLPNPYAAGPQSGFYLPYQPSMMGYPPTSDATRQPPPPATKPS